MNAVIDRTRVLTTDRLADQARAAMSALEGPEGSLLVHQGDRKSPVPRELGLVLQRVLDAMATGGTVTITAIPEEVSTATAASMLGVSRPTVVKMIRDGRLASHKVGSHHRLKSADVMAELGARRQRERAAFDELRALDI